MKNRLTSGSRCATSRHLKAMPDKTFLLTLTVDRLLLTAAAVTHVWIVTVKARTKQQN